MRENLHNLNYCVKPYFICELFYASLNKNAIKMVLIKDKICKLNVWVFLKKTQFRYKIKLLELFLDLTSLWFYYYLSNVTYIYL